MTPPRRSADRPGSLARIPWLLVIFGLALLVRALHLLQMQGSLVFETIMGDSRSYDAWARQIAAGDWLGSGVFYQAPLYPYFLALVYRWIGSDALVVRCLQAVIGAGSCVLLAGAGSRFLSKPVGVSAGLLLAVCAPAIFADTTLQKSVLDLFLTCLCLWILGGIVRSGSARGCVGLGFSVGALALSRENALLLAFALLPWLLLRQVPPGTRRAIAPVLFLIGISLALLPVALRNWSVGGELHLTTSQFGPNFFIGNNPRADGTYASLLPARGDPSFERQDATDLAEAALARRLTPGEVSDFYFRLALRYIVSQPRAWLRLEARKLSLAFNAVEVVDTEDLYTHAEASVVLRLASRLFHVGVLAPLALLGVWISWPERRRLLPLGLLFVAYTASLLAFYVVGRYRVPLLPFLVLFAAAAIVHLPGFLRTRRQPQLVACAIAFAAALLFCNWPIVDEDRMRSVTHYNLGNELHAAGRPDAAIDQYREAIRLDEDNAFANHNLGAALAGRGDLAGARRHYERALQIAPSHLETRFNLARTLWETGDLPGAIENYARGLRIDPKRPDAYEELGILYTELGELELAIECFDRALALDPDRSESQRGRQRARDARAERGGAAVPSERATSACSVAPPPRGAGVD